MKWFPEFRDELLDVQQLPNTGQTELNYRTRPWPLSVELRLVALVLLGGPALLMFFAMLGESVLGLHVFAENLLLGFAVTLVACRLCYQTLGAPTYYLTVGSLGLIMLLLCGKVRLLAESNQAWFVRGTLLGCWLTAALICRQFAAWLLAAPTVDHEQTKRWQFSLPFIAPRGLSLDCPELLSFYASLLLLGPSWWMAAWFANEILGDFSWWPVCLLGSLHLFWLTWHLLVCWIVPFPNPVSCWRMTLHSIRVFLTYDPYVTPAAGVFRFPTIWLRHIGNRCLLVLAMLLLISISAGLACTTPLEAFQERSAFVTQVSCNWLFAVLSAPAILLTVIWFAGGAVFLRFHNAFLEQPEDVTDWDVLVDRVINSQDELESDHLLVGTTMQGDYPVLLHRDILDQHMHILGDTGASKTSLGIAPLATQLIARGDSTVVIVDLKGDRALFETCRREASRTRTLRFRWLSNEVGKTSFGFNPFLQTHNHQLSLDQFVSQLLQGLSLDYGLKYGAGYFTAMNEIVLTNVLRASRARSFRELGQALQDQQLYRRIGYAEDWRQARHLSALVSRLAGSELLNIVPGMFANRPEVHTHAIDVANLYEEPQVVYLSLRSAIEATNAPTIARLFLWAMFTAASHRSNPNHRVYFFLDEFQQVISDGIKLIFEQFRDLGGTIIAAHQTAGQLHRQGTDLGETVDSCTAVKQVFRASDLESLERLEKLAGKRRERVPNWYQTYERGTGDLEDRFSPEHADEGLVRVMEEERSRLDFRRLQTISSQQQTNLLRFTHGSGYTQFAGHTVPVVSPFSMSFHEYQQRRNAEWPTAPGAFRVSTATPTQSDSRDDNSSATPTSDINATEEPFFLEFDRRIGTQG